MAHLFVRAVEQDEPRARAKHPANFRKRRDRIIHVMMHERAGRARKGAPLERQRFRARLVQSERRPLLARLREHRTGEIDADNLYARIVHRNRVVARSASDVEIRRAGRGIQMVEQAGKDVRIGASCRVVSDADRIVERHAIVFNRNRTGRTGRSCAMLSCMIPSIKLSAESSFRAQIIKQR